MSCDTARIYTDTDVEIPITLSGVDVVDVAGMTIGLFLNGTKVTEKTIGAGITLVDGQYILRIDDTDIVTPGNYVLACNVTATDGDLLGLTPSPDLLRFERNLLA